MQIVVVDTFQKQKLFNCLISDHFLEVVYDILKFPMSFMTLQISSKAMSHSINSQAEYMTFTIEPMRAKKEEKFERVLDFENMDETGKRM